MCFVDGAAVWRSTLCVMDEEVCAVWGSTLCIVDGTVLLW
jgi:hypothetical protein